MGATELLARRGRIAAVGRTRVIGMFHMDEARGDLTAIQLDTGRSTILAPEFTVTAFAEQADGDPVALGTPIVYQFQARPRRPTTASG